MVDKKYEAYKKAFHDKNQPKLDKFKKQDEEEESKDKNKKYRYIGDKLWVQMSGDHAQDATNPLKKHLKNTKTRPTHP